MSVQQYMIACCSTVKTKLNQLNCVHIYKHIEEEFLGHHTVIAHGDKCVDVDFYNRYAFHMTCVKCGKEIIQQHNRLVHKIDVTDQVNVWGKDHDSH